MTPDKLAAIEARLVDAISGERRDWHRVEVPVDDISVLLAALHTEQEARARVEAALRDIADMSPNWMKPDAILESERWMRDRARAVLAPDASEGATE